MKDPETRGLRRELPILKPPATPAKDRLDGRAGSVEGMRVLNPLRITEVYACGNPGLHDALNTLNAGRELPWVSFRALTPGKLNQKHSDGHFVLLVDYLSAPFLDPEEFRANNPNATVVLLSSSTYIGCYPPELAAKEYPYTKKADFVFHINDTESSSLAVIPAAIRCAEDRVNIEKYSQEKRFVFLVVDDEPRWISQFLPALYRIIGQRADVAIARTYEAAEEFIGQHGDKVVCLICDIYIPRGGVMGPHGKEFILSAKAQYPRFPVIIASKSEEGKELQDIALITPKGDPGSVKRLEEHVRKFTGMGPFLFLDGKDLVAQASTLSELLSRIRELPAGILEECAKRDYFSTWMYMHGFEKLGDFLKPRQDRGEKLRDELMRCIYAGLDEAAGEQFEFRDDEGRVVAVANSLKELVGLIKSLEARVVESHSHIDAYSTWLMRKGYVDLADDLRPLHGDGEVLRKELLDVFASHGIE